MDIATVNLSILYEFIISNLLIDFIDIFIAIKNSIFRYFHFSIDKLILVFVYQFM